MDPLEALTHYVTSVSGTLLLGKSFSRDDEVRKNLIHNLDIVMHEAQLGAALNFLPFLRCVSRSV